MPTTLSLFAAVDDEELRWPFDAAAAAAPPPATLCRPSFDSVVGAAAAAPTPDRRTLLRVLASLAAAPEAEPFLTPLDPEAVPGYLDVVPEPLDLSAVASLVLVGAYDGGRGAAAFVGDLRAVCLNAVAFNGTGHPLAVAAVALLRGAIPAALGRHGLGPRPAAAAAGPGWGAAASRAQAAVQSATLSVVGTALSRAPALSAAPAPTAAAGSGGGGAGDWFEPLPAVARLSLDGGYESCGAALAAVDAAVVAAVGRCGAGALPAKAPLVALRAALPRLFATDVAETCAVAPAAAEDALRPGVTAASGGVWREGPVTAPGLTDALRGQLLAAVCQLRDFDRCQGGLFSAPFVTEEYVARIEAPVDLQSLRLALVRGVYAADSSARLVADIDQIADNAVKFNGPLSDVTTAATSLRAQLPTVLASVGL